MSTLVRHASDLVAEARPDVVDVTPRDVADAIARGDALVVDLREAAERDASGTIPGAVHIPRGMLEFCADPATPYHVDGMQPDRRIILFCASGGRSTLAARTLQQMGYRDVAHLAGGYANWVEHRRADGVRPGSRA